jgi:HSP20 family protein
MSIARRNPAHPATQAGFWDRDPFQAMRELMQRDLFGGLDTLGSTVSTTFSPHVEVRETQEGLELRADLPGLTEKDVEVSLHGNRLTISGKREHEKKDEKANYYVVERSYGEFRRSFALPESFDTSKALAKMSHGVLTIAVPRVAKEEARKLEVGPG